MPKVSEAARQPVKRKSRAAVRRAQRPERIDPHQLYGIDEAGAAIDACRASIYKMIGDGRLKPIKIDGRPRIPGRQIIALSTTAAE